jgi:two-component system chemotaxis response regulator CheY
MKILIVDDSDVVRSVVRQALALGGYKDIVEAPDGEAALATAKTLHSQIGLYVLDVNMPKMDGITLVGELRKLGTQTPIIMLTTETEKSKMVRAKELGATGWIIKPFNGEKFLEVVRMFVRA